MDEGGRHHSLLVLMIRILQDVSWEGDSYPGLLIQSLAVMKLREGAMLHVGWGEMEVLPLLIFLSLSFFMDRGPQENEMREATGPN